MCDSFMYLSLVYDGCTRHIVWFVRFVLFERAAVESIPMLNSNQFDKRNECPETRKRQYRTPVACQCTALHLYRSRIGRNLDCNDKQQVHRVNALCHVDKKKEEEEMILLCVVYVDEELFALAALSLS